MFILSNLVITSFLILLLIWAFIWKNHLPYHIDASSYFYPDRVVSSEMLRHGHIPLWNSTLACGTPHLANWESACFYPPFWVFNFISLTNWFMWVTLIHSALAFFGVYFWLRSNKIQSLWSALGAFSFACSGHLVCCWNSLPFIATAAWIPWIFWSTHRALEKPIFRRWMILGTVLVLQVLAGYPFFIFYTVFFLLIWFEFQKPRIDVRCSFWLTLILSACVTALQWLPFLDFLSYGFNEIWPSYPYFTKPVEYATLFKPDFLGILGSTVYKGSFANGNFNLYFGLVPLLIFIVAFFFTRRAQSLFWVLSAGFFLLWMAGRFLVLWNFIPTPVIDFLEPSKSVGLFLFCAVTSVALTLNGFFRRFEKPKIVWAGLLSFLFVLDLFRVPFLLSFPMNDPYQNPEIRQRAQQVKKLVGDSRMLTIRTDNDMHFSGLNAFEESFKTPIRLLTVNSNSVWGIRSADGYLPLHLDGSINLKWYELKGWPYSGDLLDIAGVRFLLSPPGLSPLKFKLLENWGDHSLFQNNNASPDIRWVQGFREWNSRRDLLTQLTFSKNPWGQKVDLEKDGQKDYVHLVPAKRSLVNSIPFGSQCPDAFRVSSSFECPKAGYLVFNESYAPGWHAWVDGTPEPILRAYGLFMAVRLSAGQHQVNFHYEPTAFRLGAFISLLSLALLGFCGMARRRRD